MKNPLFIKSLFIIINCLLVTFSQQTLSKETIKINCPKQINTQESIQDIPTNWNAAHQDSEHSWQAVTFYDGHPQDNASLAPTKKSKNQSRWKFAKNRERDIFISCGYYRSAIELNQPLPKNITSCIVFYDVMSYGEHSIIPKQITCSD